jgi:aminomethyltransferase
LQAGLQWAVKLNKPSFKGKRMLEDQQAQDTYSRIVGIMMDGRAPAREGYHVFLGDRRVGEIRSGSIAPSVQNKNIATALVDKEASAPGTPLVVHIRGTAYGATVVPLPFYKRAQ